MVLRKINWAGPCIDEGVVERETAAWWFLTNGKRRKKDSLDGKYNFHTQPCQRCMDHPETYYPRGYEG